MALLWRWPQGDDGVRDRWDAGSSTPFAFYLHNREDDGAIYDGTSQEDCVWSVDGREVDPAGACETLKRLSTQDVLGS